MKRFLAITFLLLPATLAAQWTHRYPLVDGFDHQVYLEGFELPILNAGPMDPAPAPNGREVAFAAKGWLWVLDLESGEARRVTRAAGMDSRPEYAPDGRSLVFVRDDGRALSIVTVELKTGRERVLVDVEAVNLDPVYSPDGEQVYYASAEGGPLEIWQVDVESLERFPVTTSETVGPRPVKRRPLVLDPGSLLVYLHKQGTRDAIELLNLRTGQGTTLAEDRITAQADLSLSPDGRLLAYTWPLDGGWGLRLKALNAADTSVLLTRGRGMPLAPAFSADGKWVWFAEADEEERTQLRRVPATGGPAETVTVGQWDWGVPTGELVISPLIEGRAAPVRLSVTDAAGHPLVPRSGLVRFDGQNGQVFFYTDKGISLQVPAGPVTVRAVQGFETPEAVLEVEVEADATTRAELDLERIWDASAAGWYAADTHFHLNYGGPYRLQAGDIVRDLRGEGVDFATPLLANLHNRFLQQDLWGWKRDEAPHIIFGQEVRSHFLGHLLLIGTERLYWPWIWGPGYQVYGADDRLNAEVLRHARAEGGLGGYVHPVGVPDPFTDATYGEIPVSLIADAVLGEVDLLEVACLWTDEIGTAAVWHHLLNLGIPLAASAGSDVMNNYYRTMAIGATRVYVRPLGEPGPQAFLEALGAGRSFVTNGPLLEFAAGGAQPGEAFAPEDGSAAWSLTVHSALPFDGVQLFVNGSLAAELEGRAEPGSHRYSGELALPEGGWITARVLGAEVRWPAMDSYLYAETSPVWIEEIGSTDPAVARQSAGLLLHALDAAEQKLRGGYGAAPIPKLLEHFARARAELARRAGDQAGSSKRP